MHVGSDPPAPSAPLLSPFSGDTTGAPSYGDSNTNQGQLTHSQLQLGLTGTVGVTPGTGRGGEGGGGGCSIQMGE